jgi:AraC family transcriptional regulator
MVSRAWINEPIHSHVGPMEHHVIAPTLRADGYSTVRFGSKVMKTRSITGGVTVAPRGFSGDFDCDGRPLASNVFLGKTRLQQCADEHDGGRPPELLPRLNAHDPKLFSILALITWEAEDLGAHSRLYIERLIDLLCLELLRNHASFALTTRPGPGGLRQWQVQRVTAYMLEHLDEPIGLEELANLLQLSRFYFCTAFRRSTGCTPYHWLVRLRMSRAKELLSQPGPSSTEVALAVGYQTPSSFAQAFRLCTGLTPSAYQREMRT